MKTILEGFRGYIHEAEFSEYSKGGNVILYHYMRKPRIGEETEDTVLIDPKYFADPKTRSSYSRNEYEVSTVPRTFWYVNPRQRERQVAQQSILYIAKVSADKIYDLRTDPEGYKKAVAHPVYGLRKGVEWNTLLEKIREDYEGVFYGGSFDVVSLFTPHTASRVPEEKQASLEG
jgi:hypothetical protein